MTARRTKIVATIGPASESAEMLAALVDAGMDMARLSLAHGPVEETLDRMARVRSVAEAKGRHIGVLVDLPGPKVRATGFEGDGVLLREGSTVEIAEGQAPSTDRRVVVEQVGVLTGLQSGDLVALGDGAIRLVVEEVAAGHLVARVVTGGWARGRPGLVLPARSPVESPTAEDLRLLRAVTDAGADAVAVSFVRSGADLDRARQVAPDTMLIAKIETREAVDALPGVIAASDGVMVARGDLGLRCALEDVPHHQKHIIRTGVAFGRPVITATQMLESMVTAPTPTRAEVTDIANAVFDGTSALMLSGETAIGQHPVAAVATMARIAERAEREFDYHGWGRGLGRVQTLEATKATMEVRITTAVSAAAWRAAVDADVAAIIACTSRGTTARAISRFRPTMAVIAATPSPRTARQLSVAWGVTPMVTDHHGTTDDIVWFAVKSAVERGLVASGELVAVLVGSPSDDAPTTDTLRLVRVR